MVHEVGFEININNMKCPVAERVVVTVDLAALWAV